VRQTPYRLHQLHHLLERYVLMLLAVIACLLTRSNTSPTVGLPDMSTRTTSMFTKARSDSRSRWSHDWPLASRSPHPAGPTISQQHRHPASKVIYKVVPCRALSSSVLLSASRSTARQHTAGIIQPRRTWTICRQLQQLRRTLQVLFPVLRLLLQYFRLPSASAATSHNPHTALPTPPADLLPRAQNAPYNVLNSLNSTPIDHQSERCGAW